LKQGFLKPTIPDKPTSSKQKYYATKEKKITHHAHRTRFDKDPLEGV
jgi:hypothetical protein